MAAGVELYTTFLPAMEGVAAAVRGTLSVELRRPQRVLVTLPGPHRITCMRGDSGYGRVYPVMF
jgi:hypothetical protein